MNLSGDFPVSLRFFLSFSARADRCLFQNVFAGEKTEKALSQQMEAK